MTLKITRYTPFRGEGPVMGVCCFTLDSLGMYFNDVPVIRKREGGFFIGSPSRKYEDADGQTKYSPYWGFENREMASKFQGAAITALKAYWDQMNQGNGQQVQASPATASAPPPTQPQQRLSPQPQPSGPPGMPEEPDWMPEIPDEGLPF